MQVRAAHPALRPRAGPTSPTGRSTRWRRSPPSRVLDLLHTVKWDQDGSLTFRRSCAHGVCGSDAMLINGRNRLACKIRVDQLGRKISVAPLPGLKVIKDLVVDMDEFFAKYRSVMPFQVDDDVMPARERRQSQEDRERYDDTTKCILCAACTSSCPSFWAQDSYVGPAAIVNAHRFIFDTRDAGAGRAAGDPVRRGWRLALPHHLQLHGCLPARHQHHARHPRGLVRPSWSVGSEPARCRRGRRHRRTRDEVPRLRRQFERLVIRTDGASRGNPGPRLRGCGAHRCRPSRMRSSRTRMAVAVVARDLGIRTNNVAEYAGLVLALREAALLGAQEVDLRLDSKLIVEQLNGRWRVKDAKLQGLFAEAIRHLKALRRWSAVHEPRARNHAADALANMALDDPFGAERVTAEVRRRADEG